MVVTTHINKAFMSFQASSKILWNSEHMQTAFQKLQLHKMIRIELVNAKNSLRFHGNFWLDDFHCSPRKGYTIASSYTG